jgi:hypothetical protein
LSFEGFPEYETTDEEEEGEQHDQESDQNATPSVVKQ